MSANKTKDEIKEGKKRLFLSHGALTGAPMAIRITVVVLFISFYFFDILNAKTVFNAIFWYSVVLSLCILISSKRSSAGIFEGFTPRLINLFSSLIYQTFGRIYINTNARKANKESQ